MTREEVIDILMLRRDCYDELSEALAMAIEALSADSVSRKDTVTLNSPITIQAEMAPVVRCKDCRHQEYCHETVAHTKDHDGFREHWSEPIEWCSRGECKGGKEE